MTVERLNARVAELEEALESWVAQHGCSCGHPACRRCRDTREAKALLGPLEIRRWVP